MSAAHSMVDLLSASKALGQIITPIIVLGTIDYDNGNSLYPTQPWGVRQRALNSHCSWAFIPWIMSYCSCCYRKDHLNLREAPFYIFFTIRHQMPFVWYYHAIQRNQKRFILLLADFEDSVSDGPHVSPPMLLPRGLSTHDPKLSIHKHPRTFLDWRALTLQLKASVYAPPISRLANKKTVSYAEKLWLTYRWYLRICITTYKAEWGVLKQRTLLEASLFDNDFAPKGVVSSARLKLFGLLRIGQTCFINSHLALTALQISSLFFRLYQLDFEPLGKACQLYTLACGRLIASLIYNRCGLLGRFYWE